MELILHSIVRLEKMGFLGDNLKVFSLVTAAEG